MARLVWVTIGAAAGALAYRSGSAAVARARERSLVDNAKVASQTVGKVAGGTARAVAAAGRQGAKVTAMVPVRRAEHPGPVMAVAPEADRGGS